LFGAPLADPTAAANAVAAGHAMLAAVDSWNAVRPARALCVGVGSMAARRLPARWLASAQEYTLIGDAVPGCPTRAAHQGDRRAAAGVGLNDLSARCRSAAMARRCGSGSWRDVALRHNGQHLSGQLQGH